MNDATPSPISATPAIVHSWLADSMDAAVSAAVGRLSRTEDVRRIAVMPDVHLANDVCVGTVVATSRLVFPAAVGGDIGCGMLAVGFDAGGELLADAKRAAELLKTLYGAVPAMRRHRSRLAPIPQSLRELKLSHAALEAVVKSDGLLQLGTLGGGNHFVELQTDEADRLWLMIHTGSRAIGQAVRGHHLSRASRVDGGLMALDASTGAGQAYVHDMEWARRYADANRRAIADAVIDVVARLFGVPAVESTLITCDHNHVAREEHDGQVLWVHCKGAMPAGARVGGVLPGSMGTVSYHVEGRGCAASMCSSAHGAGRALSRNAARKRFTQRDLVRQMDGVWFDPRLADSLREEAPRAYKDVRAVLRAQHELVRITRTLRPVLTYKAGNAQRPSS